MLLLSDQDLLASLSRGRCVERDQAAAQLGELIKKSLAKGFGSQLSEADLDDLTQQSLERVISKLGTFQGRSKLSTWAMSIAINTTLGELRKRKYKSLSWEELMERGEASFELKAPGDDANSMIERAQRDQILERAVHEVLTEKQRAVLIAELEGVPLMEISRRMGASRGALYKMMHDARRRLRSHFEERGFSLAELVDERGRKS